MPLTFVPRNNESKSFDHAVTPDCGAMILLISKDLVVGHGLHLDRNNRVGMVVANSSPMQCFWTVEGAGKHKFTKRSIDLELKVLRNLKDEIIISCWDLVRFRVHRLDFPFPECNRIEF